MFTIGWCGGMSAIGWVAMALLWGSLLAVIAWAVARLFPRTNTHPDDDKKTTGTAGHDFSCSDVDQGSARPSGDLTRTARRE